jgi:hypothetical protein
MGVTLTCPSASSCTASCPGSGATTAASQTPWQTPWACRKTALTPGYIRSPESGKSAAASGGVCGQLILGTRLPTSPATPLWQLPA